MHGYMGLSHKKAFPCNAFPLFSLEEVVESGNRAQISVKIENRTQDLRVFSFAYAWYQLSHIMLAEAKVEDRGGWPQSMGIGASLKIQCPILTEPETPIPNTHKVQNSNTPSATQLAERQAADQHISGFTEFCFARNLTISSIFCFTGN